MPNIMFSNCPYPITMSDFDIRTIIQGIPDDMRGGPQVQGIPADIRGRLDEIIADDVKTRKSQFSGLMGPTRPKAQSPADESISRIEWLHKQSENLPKPVHRGDMETEVRNVDGKDTVCVRVYLTVYGKTDSKDTENKYKSVLGAHFLPLRVL